MGTGRQTGRTKSMMVRAGEQVDSRARRGEIKVDTQARSLTP